MDRDDARTTTSKPDYSEGHRIRYNRRRLGKTMITNRQLWGYTVRCACGFEQRVNAPKRDAEKVGRRHRRDHGLAGTGE